VAPVAQSQQSREDSIVPSILLVLFAVYLYLFLKPLKLAASNLVYNLDLGCSLSSNNF